MDSTKAIIRLWRLCTPGDVGPQSGGDGALPVSVLMQVLEPELQDKIASLGGNSVEHVLREYMSPDMSDTVGFLQFWKGMEDILKMCGTHRVSLDTGQAHAIEGFRFLRNCVLEFKGKEESQGRSVLRVWELRHFIERTTNYIERATNFSDSAGVAYWRDQANLLPKDDVQVTGEEVTSALLKWLEDLVDPEEGDSAEEGDSEDQEPLTPEVLDDSADEGAAWNRGEDEEEEEEEEEEEHLETPSKLGSWMRPPSPQGPPPARGVHTTGASSGYSALRRHPGVDVVAGASGAACPVPSTGSRSPGSCVNPVVQNLTMVLKGYQRRPPSPTKEQAAEWRDAVEFHVALTRQLQDAQGREEELTLAWFHNFARSHVAAVKKRTPRSVSPRRRAATCSKGTQVVAAVLRELCVKRVEVGWGALLAAWRSQPSQCGSPGRGDFNMFPELLKAQCQTAVVLEKRVKEIGRAGGIAFHLARLIRMSLRGAMDRWAQVVLQPGGPPPLLPRNGARCSPVPSAGTPSNLPWAQRSPAPSPGVMPGGLGVGRRPGGGVPFQR